MRRPDLTIATMDHNVPTEPGPIGDLVAKAQLDALAANCEEFGVPLNGTGSGREGIVHVIGPELGLTQPGMAIVCGDSHTSTHGAFGTLSLRDRHLGGPAHDRDPDACGSVGPGRCSSRLTADLPIWSRRQRHHAGDHRPHRRWGRRPARHRVCRTGDRRDVDGTAHDGLQHVDRGRRPRRHDRAGRDDLELRRRPSGCSTRRRPKAALAYWQTLPSDPDATFDTTIDLDARDIAPR